MCSEVARQRQGRSLLEGQIIVPPHKTLSQWALGRLREMIVYGHLRAGERLFEADLAKRMGISRTPVREAVRQLEREGLVTVFPNRETIVTAFSADDVREIYQLRAAIEGMAAFIAAETRNQTCVERILEVITLMRSELDAGNQAAYLELDVAFHDAVVEASRNSRLVEARMRIRDQTRRYLTFTLGRVPDEGMRRNFGEHEAIAEAIRSGQAASAEAQMRTHVSWSGDRIAQEMAETPDRTGAA